MTRPKEIDGLEKLQREDHDRLIRLESKIDNLSSDVKDMKDGTQKEMADHELRIRQVERAIEATDLENSYQKFLTLQRNFDIFQASSKAERRVWGIVGGALGGTVVMILTQALGWIKLFIK